MAFQLTVDGHQLVVNVALALEAWGYVAPAVPAPTNLRTTATTSSTISLAWTSTAPAGSVFTLQRAPVTNGAVGAFATIYTGTNSAYTDSGRAFITTYAYRVLVTVNGVPSAYSAVLQATTAGGGTGPNTAFTYTLPFNLA
jgi:chitin-binding protein